MFISKGGIIAWHNLFHTRIDIPFSLHSFMGSLTKYKDIQTPEKQLVNKCLHATQDTKNVEKR